MSDYRMEVIRSVETGLTGRLTDAQIQMVSDEIIKALDGFDVVVEDKKEIMEYKNINESIVKRYCACLMIEGKSEKTIYGYARLIRKMYEQVQKNYTEMGVYDIRLFLAFEKQRGVSNQTLENTRAYISAFFQWMEREELIDKNPCANVKTIKCTDKVRTPFSTVEIDALRMACKNDKERAIIELLLSSGVRVDELTHIKISDIDFNNLSVHITHGKGDKERTVFIDELAKTHICKYILSKNAPGDYLFHNRWKNRLGNGGVRSILNALGTRAGVDNVHPHRFRRTFASGLAARGMNVQEIQKLLGHSDINTTMRYVSINENMIQNSYRRYTA